MASSKFWQLITVVVIASLLIGCAGNNPQVQPQAQLQEPPQAQPQGEPQAQSQERQIEITTTGQTLAKDLADRLSQAKTDKDRFEALLYVMRAFDVGVYTPEGQPILRGAERSSKDFYLYDFEIDLMARSLGRQQTWSITELAANLTEMGIGSNDKPLDPAELRQALKVGVVAASQKPQDDAAVIPLLLREQGLRQAQPYDMLQGITDETQFDTLQTWLILVDVAIPIIREAPPLADSATPATLPVGFVRARPMAQNDLCTDIGNLAKELWSGSKFWIFLKTTPNPVKMALVATESIHGLMMAWSVGVKMVPDAQRVTHYGHEEPGNQLRYGLQVEMMDDLPDIVVKCGWLAAVEFPKKGPIEGVTVLWMVGDLDRLGKLNCGFPCTTKTGADGIAHLVFTPNQEKQPYGAGVQRQRNGTIYGMALYQSKLKNYAVGGIAQLLYHKYGQDLWFVSYHYKPVWEGIITYKIHAEGTRGDGLASGGKHGSMTLSVDVTRVIYIDRDGQATESTTFSETRLGELMFKNCDPIAKLDLLTKAEDTTVGSAHGKIEVIVNEPETELSYPKYSISSSPTTDRLVFLPISGENQYISTDTCGTTVMDSENGNDYVPAIHLDTPELNEVSISGYMPYRNNMWTSIEGTKTGEFEWKTSDFWGGMFETGEPIHATYTLEWNLDIPLFNYSDLLK